MKDLEREFEQMVRANRSTIYTVCYMFSNDQDALDRKKRRNKTVPLTMDIDPYEEVESNQNSRQMDMLRQRIAKEIDEFANM
jgi:RNA polymerase sigma-70 factor (ECF subfamily)